MIAWAIYRNGRIVVDRCSDEHGERQQLMIFQTRKQAEKRARFGDRVERLDFIGVEDRPRKATA